MASTEQPIKDPPGNIVKGEPGLTEDTQGTETVDVVYKLRDRNKKMVAAWEAVFAGKDYFQSRIEISSGDIFKSAPAADSLVSPANSFGFMDGGIDMVYTRHFGWQMSKRLQNIIRTEYDGELLVGQATILPTFEGGAKEDSMDWSQSNEGQPVKFLISAPTMRVPMDILETVNAYLAFRAVILAVKKHNANLQNEPIRSVLCPGLGTAVGRMPFARCAFQMAQAFEIFDLCRHNEEINPPNLEYKWTGHESMTSH